MTLITVNCTDQSLKVTASPGVASGGVNEDRVAFTFCGLWTDYIKTAVFYRTADKVYHVLLDEENTCIIPKEVLANPGVLHIGVFGVKGESVRTSNVLSYLVAQGAITEATAVPDPTPDIYAQLLSTMGDLNKLATADKSSLVAAVNEVYRTGGGVPVVYTSGDGKLYEAEIEGVKSYSDIPMIILVPHVSSATVTPSLLIKGMTTAVPIRRNNTYQTGNNYTESGATATWLTADTPVLLLWNGRSWVALSQSQTYGGDIDGTIPVRSGGTGRDTLTEGSYLVGNGTNAVALKTAEEVREDIDALGTSELPKAIDTALAQAKASGEFDGAGGKTAYQYAVDGGYTGTEEDFAAKLAAAYLPLTGGTMAGSIIFPNTVSIRSSGDVRIFGYASANKNFNVGDPGYTLYFRGAGDRPNFNDSELALVGDSYSKEEIDAIMGSYITDIDALIGGDA